ncbi:MAG: hypothetical protein HPY60_05725 [Candidatus Methanofastidiosum sp.]|nr:hypothetical protein [Methanofastidiosum sp.]
MERIISQDFKETEIGPLPKEWEVVRLEEIASIRNETILPKYSLNGIYVGLEHIIPSQIKMNNWGNSSEVKSTKNIFYKGDILYGKLRPYLDKSVICDRKGICSTDIVVLKPNTNIIDNIFLAYFIHHDFFIRYAIKTMTGVNHPRTSWSKLKHLSIPLPPLPEQIAIANVLSTVQESIEKNEAVINSTKELKKSLMNHLFTYGPVSVSEAENVKIKESEVGLIPDDWEIVRLGDIFEIQQGITLCRESSPGKYLRPFLRTSNVFWGKIDLSILDSMYFSEKQLQSLILKSKDLLICEGGDIGRTAMWNEQISECCHQNHLHRLRVKNGLKIKSEFYMYWMQFGMLMRGLYSEEGNKTTIPNLSRSRLSNFIIPLPPLPIQKQIADILSEIDRKIKAEENKAKALEKLFQSMLNDLMTGKIRVGGEVA